MERFVDLTLAGVTSGAIYAAVALALVLIWRATRIVNFAQGGMLMITTFIGYTVIQHGGSYWLALAVAIVSGLVLGAVVERVLIRPVENRSPLSAVVVTFGLLVLLQGLAGMIFGGTPRSYPPAFSIIGFGNANHRLLFAPNDLWVVLVVVGVMAVLALVFRRTSIGLRMRAAAFGALAGVLVAPTTFVSPTAFDATLVYGFTAAVIGGLDSPPGAVVGGASLGLALSYVSGYLGSDLVPLGALVVLMVVLMVRPSGLFGAPAGRRV